MKIDWRQIYEDLQSVDLNDLSSASYSVKVIGMGLLTLLILGGGYFFLVRGDIGKLHAQRAEEVTLKNQYMNVKREAMNLPAYRKQMKHLDVVLATLMQQLPTSTRMPDFVTEVTQAGQACGLQIKLLQPRDEKAREFYAELPISLTVAGSYAQLGHFVGDIAAMSRIITLGDIQIKPVKSGGDFLSMAMVAKTYRYIANPPPVKKK